MKLKTILLISIAIIIYSQVFSQCVYDKKKILDYEIPSVNTLTTGWSKDNNYSDEFNGGSLDASKWHPVTGTHSAVPNGYFKNDPDNIKVEGGFLKLIAIKENYMGKKYTTGQIQSFFDEGQPQGPGHLKYGYIEIEAVLPYHKGVNPCFWLWGSNGRDTTDPLYRYDEIDVFELYHNYRNYFMQNVYHNLNANSQTQVSVNVYNSQITNNRTVIISVEWLPEEVNFYINRNLSSSLRYTTNSNMVENSDVDPPFSDFTCTHIYDPISQRIILWNGVNKYVDKYNYSSNVEFKINYIRTYKLQEGIDSEYWPTSVSLSNTNISKVHKSVKLGGDSRHKAIIPSGSNITIWAKEGVILEKGFEIPTNTQFTARVIETEEELFK